MKLRQLPYADQRCMRVSVIAIPYWCVAGGSVISNAFNRHLDRSSCVSNEHHIKLIGVGIEEAEGAFADRVNAAARKC